MADNNGNNGIPFEGVIAPLIAMYPVSFPNQQVLRPPHHSATGEIVDDRWRLNPTTGEWKPVVPYRVTGVTIVIDAASSYDKVALEKKMISLAMRNPFISQVRLAAPHNMVTAEMWDMVIEVAQSHPDALKGSIIVMPRTGKDGSTRGWPSLMAKVPRSVKKVDTPIHQAFVSRGLGATPTAVAAYVAAHADQAPSVTGISKDYSFLFPISSCKISLRIGGRNGDSIEYAGSYSRGTCASPAQFEKAAALLLSFFDKGNISILTGLAPDAIKTSSIGSVTWNSAAGETSSPLPLPAGHGITPADVSSYLLYSNVRGDSVIWHKPGATQGKARNIPMLHAKWSEGVADNVDIITLMQVGATQGKAYNTREHCIQIDGIGVMSLYKASFTLTDQSDQIANKTGVNFSVKSLRLDDFVITSPPVVIDRPVFQAAPITRESKARAVSDLEAMFC